MKTVLMQVEVTTDEDWEDLVAVCADLLDNPQDGALGKLVAYSTYNEDDKIPDILNRKEF